MSEAAGTSHSQLKNNHNLSCYTHSHVSPNIILLQHIVRVVGICWFKFYYFCLSVEIVQTRFKLVLLWNFYRKPTVTYNLICHETAENTSANWAKWWTWLNAPVCWTKPRLYTSITRQCHNTTSPHFSKDPLRARSLKPSMVIPSFFLFPGTSKSRLCKRVPGNRKSATLDPPSTFHDAS